MKFNEVALASALCRKSFREFVKEFVHIVVPEFKWNWHIEVMCLPGEAEIVTEGGIKTIQEVVDSKWDGRVLSFNHESSKYEWHRVISWIKSPGRPLVTIRTIDGRHVTCTENHPIYTKERGYVDAAKIRAGETVIVSELWEGYHSYLRIPDQEILFSDLQLLAQEGTDGAEPPQTSLSDLWQDVLPISRRKILFSPLLGEIQGDTNGTLRSVRQGVGVPENCEVSFLLDENEVQRKDHSLSTVRQREIPQSRSSNRRGRTAVRQVLQHGLFQQVRHRREKSSLRQRKLLQRVQESLPSRVLANPPQGQETGFWGVFPLRRHEREEQRSGSRLPPHQLEYFDQQALELSDALPQVPRQTERIERAHSQVCESVVSSVEREIRIPSSVYNIEVESVHNYFVDGVLTHNCSELQRIAERVFAGLPREYDFVCNIAPGSTKSTIFSILFPAWVWTRMPTAKIIGASYAHLLALDLSRKCRDVIRNKKYLEYFPEITLREDQNTKTHFVNSQGGVRYATGAGGTIQGFHFDFICLPWESKIHTSEGLLPIGQIVDNQMEVDILAYDHANGRTRWQKIEKHETNPGRELCRVNFTDGTWLELTEDHPVYVQDSGYVFPANLIPGDRVIYAHDSLRPLSEDVLVLEQKNPHVEIRQELLFGVVSEESKTQCGHTPMRRLQKEDESVQLSEGRSEILQLQMSELGIQRRKSSQVEEKIHHRMSDLRKGNYHTRGTTGLPKKSLLLENMCRQATFPANERRRQFQLSSRQECIPVFSGFSAEKEIHQEEREMPLLSVRQNPERTQKEIVSSSCRLRQDEQQQDESSRIVHLLSQHDARQRPSEASGLSQKIVSHVDRKVRLSPKTYNLSVSGDHNYFAEGILVHNCIDDPIDPNGVLSDQTLENTNYWIRNVLSGRKTDRMMTVTILVMQRLHQNDPTQLFLEKKRVRHLCLPAMLAKEFPVIPPELTKYYKNGLMDPVRLPQEFLDEEREPVGGMGEFAFAGQYGQQPVPIGGGKFDVRKLRWGRVPDKFKRIFRFWDKAATVAGSRTSSKGPAFTVGFKMGLDLDNTKVWVLDVRRFRTDSFSREQTIELVARNDTKDCQIGLEQEPGSGGKDSALGTVKRLRGYRVKIMVARGNKSIRADEFSVALNGGMVFLPEAMREGDSWVGWAKELVEELKYWPNSRFKDQGDAAGGCFSCLQTGLVRVGPLKRRDAA